MSDKYEIQERRTGALKFRVTLFFLFFFLAVISVFIIMSTMQINAVTRFIGEGIGVPTVTLIEEMIDGDRFEALSNSLNPMDPYYEVLRSRMTDIKHRTAGCEYLYTMAPVSGTIYRYVIDGSSPDEEGFSALGEEEDIGLWQDSFLDTVRTGEITLSPIVQNEDWGKLISVFAPIRNSENKQVGIIGCDLKAEGIVNWIRASMIWQIGLVVALTLLGLAVYLSLMRRINRLFS